MDVIEKQNGKTSNKLSFVRRFRWSLIAVAVVVGIAIFMFLQGISGKTKVSGKSAGIFTVTRGDLTISRTESGEIKALNSKDIKSEVEGRTTIINIVPEGAVITPEDVNNGKILVELDSSEIKQKLTGQEITFLNAQAGNTEAKEALDIQKKQNDSDIQKGQLNVRFALMDLQKYLGETVSEKIMSKTSNRDEITSLVEDPSLGGEALQKLRELQADINLREQEFQQAKSKLEWTERLYDANYVSRTDLEADTLSKNRCSISCEKAKTAKDLFIKYEFPKETDKLLSAYHEAERELERIEAGARSKSAQVQAKLESAQATFALQKELLEKWRKQFAACIIKAPAPGQIVYSSSMGSDWERQNRPIEVGAEIRERQKIISIPDPSVMKVEIKIHETWIDKVEVNQPAKITVAAFPEKSFTGKVIKKAPLADAGNWWNRDLKVYSADVNIDGTYDFLKTGMTAKVEVIIDELKNVLGVPLQAVVGKDGRKFCSVVKGNRTQQVEVETGAFNDNFVEIKNGLAEDDKVLLNPPRLTESPELSGSGPKTVSTAKEPKGAKELTPAKEITSAKETRPARRSRDANR